MNNKNLIALAPALIVLVLSPACSDDAATDSGSGTDSTATETGDGDGDGDGGETSDSNSGDGDGDPAGDGDGDPSGDGDGDPSGDGDGDPSGDGDGDPSGDGDGDPSGDGDGDPTGDGDGDGDGDLCGDGMVSGAEACDDGINDGSYDGCAADCLSFGPSCGDGEVNGPETCDDQNDDSADGCLGSCVVPGSCLEILDYDEASLDGDYMISPKPDTPWLAPCDMTTEGGGWTGITVDHTCNGDLDSTLTPILPAQLEGIDMMTCRPFTRNPGDHTYTFDVEFPPGFDEFYIGSDYLLEAFASGNGNTSDLDGASFTQTDWDVAFGNVHGDVSFGSADDPGPVTSFGAEGTNIDCVNCQEPFLNPDVPYATGMNTATLRLGWGESGGQDEGWLPWFEGTIWLR